jgi:hypothetical protein
MSSTSCGKPVICLAHHVEGKTVEAKDTFRGGEDFHKLREPPKRMATSYSPKYIDLVWFITPAKVLKFLKNVDDKAGALVRDGGTISAIGFSAQGKVGNETCPVLKFTTSTGHWLVRYSNLTDKAPKLHDPKVWAIKALSNTVNLFAGM